jgi:hypothetical protein
MAFNTLSKKVSTDVLLYGKDFGKHTNQNQTA